MSYNVGRFVKPIRFNDDQHIEPDESEALRNFRYERVHSPMGKMMQEYFEKKNDANA